MHKPKRHELREAASLFLDIAQEHHLVHPVSRFLDMAVHHRRCAAYAQSCAVLMTSIHCSTLAFADISDSAPRCPISRPPSPAGSQGRVLQHLQVIASGQTGFINAMDDLHWREGVNMHVGHRFLDGNQHIAIVVAIQVAWQAALYTDLCGTAFAGFKGALLDFIEAEKIGVWCPASG